MGKNIAVKVENLSKAYQLGQIGTGTISRDIERFWATKIRGKEDPFLKIGQTNDRTVKGESDIVWSLEDINFEIEQGDAVGIIGRNGAGKSTLLKLLSRVTAPTTGNIKVKGRIASLLEVGTGFHPELTGRENIYLNGAILGMRKKEITRKFDEIVAFSGVERYIDTPVKRYSSGMYVRLAFAVAAHLESEILIVDEVLAVGDAEFQKKCLGKMSEVSDGMGKTVLFVSHNLNSISSLCNKSILLVNGNLRNLDKTNKIIAEYRETLENKKTDNSNIILEEHFNRPYNFNFMHKVKFVKMIINSTSHIYHINDKIDLEFYISSIEKMDSLRIAYSISDVEENSLGTSFGDEILSCNKYSKIKVEIPELNLTPGTYFLSFSIGKGNEFVNITDFDIILNAYKFIIDDNDIKTQLQLIKWESSWGKFVLPKVKIINQMNL